MYIEALKGYNSEALPSLAQLKILF